MLSVREVAGTSGRLGIVLDPFQDPVDLWLDGSLGFPAKGLAWSTCRCVLGAVLAVVGDRFKSISGLVDLTATE